MENKKYIIAGLIIILISGSIYSKIKSDNSSVVDTFVLKTLSPSESTVVENSETQTYTTPTAKNIKVYITGEVLTPGVYNCVETDRIEDVVLKAGGFTEEADKENINLASIVKDEQHIVIGNINDQVPNQQYNGTETGNKDGKININTATKAELESLSGVGSVLADNIIKYREENNGFNTIQDIKKVNRVGDKVFENLKDSITVN